MASPTRESLTTDFNIMLWNVSSRKSEQGMASRILLTMEDIVQSVTDTQPNYINLMCLCTDRISQRKASILKRVLHGREIPNTEAEVYYAEGMKVRYLELYCSRVTVTIITDRKGQKTLVASWHGPNPKPVGKGHRANVIRRWTAHGYARANRGRHRHDDAVRIVKYRQCLAMLKRLEELKMEHGCSAAIVGGDFNLTPDVVREIVEKDLPDRHVEVADDYENPKDRSNKLDFLVYWPKWAFRVRSTSLIAEDLRWYGDNIVFDHPIVMYNLQDWSQYDLDGDFGAPNVALRKREIMKTDAAFTFSCSSPAMTDDHAEQILNKLKLGSLYRVEGSVVLQAPDGSADLDGESKTVCWPTQLFFSKRYSTFGDLVEFDKDVRECAGRSDCTTVFGIFHLKGSVRTTRAMPQYRRGQQNKKMIDPHRVNGVKTSPSNDMFSSVSTPMQQVANASSETSNTPATVLQEVSSCATVNVAFEGIATSSGIHGHGTVTAYSMLTAISSNQAAVSTHHQSSLSVTQPEQDLNVGISANVMKCAPQTVTQQTNNTTKQHELDIKLAEVTPPQKGTDPSFASSCVPGNDKKHDDCAALQNPLEQATAGSVYCTDSCMHKGLQQDILDTDAANLLSATAQEISTAHMKHPRKMSQAKSNITQKRKGTFLLQEPATSSKLRREANQRNTVDNYSTVSKSDESPQSQSIVGQQMSEATLSAKSSTPQESLSPEKIRYVCPPKQRRPTVNPQKSRTKKHHTPNDTKTDGLNLQGTITEESKFSEQQQTNTPPGNPEPLKCGSLTPPPPPPPSECSQMG